MFAMNVFMSISLLNQFTSNACISVNIYVTKNRRQNVVIENSGHISCWHIIGHYYHLSISGARFSNAKIFWILPNQLCEMICENVSTYNLTFNLKYNLKICFLKKIKVSKNLEILEFEDKNREICWNFECKQ